MHPLEKIIILISLCQVVTTIYLVAHVHILHGVSRLWYLVKILPLLALTAILVMLVLRVFQIIPYVGI